jgi:hypothetical protein
MSGDAKSSFEGLGGIPWPIACELITWRKLHAPLVCLVDRVVAAQGDKVEPEHVTIQHQLAELGRVK